METPSKKQRFLNENNDEELQELLREQKQAKTTKATDILREFCQARENQRNFEEPWPVAKHFGADAVTDLAL